MEKTQAHVLLKQMLGPGAEFRDGQWEAIDLAANRRQRLLVVQRTGWGKSVVYFLAAKILRDAGAGPALLISPLLSLMRNQILAAERLGIRAVTIHSENLHEWESVEAALRENAADVLMVSPERLANKEFFERLLPLVSGNIGMFVVDEAHCISDWGHDFRPDYRRIVRVLRLLPPKVPVLCTTATANDRVVKDIETQIPHLHVLRGPLVRRSLKLYTIKLASQAERLAWLAHFVPHLPGNGIIYTLTVQDARRVAEWLKSRGISAQAYHADLEGGERIAIETQLLNNQVKALVATVALGMGFDKPDLGFVIHFQRPGSVVAYYQQVGRAGRAVESAYGILLSGREDDEIQEYFIKTAFPPLEVMEGILKVLGRGAFMTVEQLGAELNYTRGAMEKGLRLLEVEGAVEHDKSGYGRTANRWRPDTARFERVTQHRRAELEEIKRYVEHGGCLMEFLSRALDDPAAAPCGKCMNCAGKTQRQQAPAELVQAAVNFLRGDALVLAPRTRWPKPLLSELEEVLPRGLDRFETGKPKVVMPEAVRAQEGRALCIYGDSGWGQEVADGKYGKGRFSEALIGAAAELIREQWKPNPPPEWITFIPSEQHPELVQDFARRLAVCLGLPVALALRKCRGARCQKEMQNSAMQLRNVLKAFRIIDVPSLAAARGDPAHKTQPGMLERMKGLADSLSGREPRVPPGPVLLVDDMVDSGWTLTLAAALLRLHGSGPVYPFALAKASPRGG
ncbi:MAG TPA: RecQ family ATP-dependent DNA helicase [Verrucomicrobiae bacterium]